MTHPYPMLTFLMFPGQAGSSYHTGKRIRLFFFLPILLLFLTQASAQPLSRLWDKRFGGTDLDLLYRTIATSDGGFLLGGYSGSEANGDKTQPSQGGADYWVVRIDADGNQLWDKRFGGTGGDFLYSMVTASDGGFLLGGWSSSGADGDKTEDQRGGGDYWVVRIDANGNKLWDKRFGGTRSEELRSMVATSDGGFLLGGYSNSGADGDKTDPSQGGFDYWAVRIDANGNKLWDKRFGGTRSEELRSTVATSDGGFLLGGWSSSEADGDKTQPSQGNNDYWVVRIDANGNQLWDKRFGGTNDEYLHSMVTASDGGFLLGGRSSSGADGDKTQPSQGSYDYWVVRIDANGNQLWDKRLGGAKNEELHSMVTASDGGFLLGGYSFSEADGDKTQPSQGGFDYWAVRIDANGNQLWDKRLGGANRDEAESLTATSDGGFLVGGWSFSGADGDKTQPSQGSSDFWVVKLGTCALTASISPNTSQNVCSGAPLSLNGSSTGGSSPVYAWSSSPAGFSSALQNPTFTAPSVAVSTDYTLTLTVTEAECTAMTTVSVTVHPLPPAPTVTPSGPLTLCPGSSVVLTSNSATGNQWYRDGNLINAATDQTYSATQTGNYTVSVTVSGCPSPPSAAASVVNDTQPPTVTCPANIIVCEGEIVNFAAPEGNDNCPGVMVTQTAGLPSGSAYPAGITTNVFTVTDAAGNSAACSFTVTVKPTPTAILTASQVDVCPNTEVTLNPNCSIPAATVQWNPGAPTVTPDAPNAAYTYKVSCTFEGCTGDESSIEVRTHRILVDLKNVDTGVQPKALAGAIKDNLAPTNTITAPLSPRLWTLVATGCSASESAVLKLTGPVNFNSIDNNPPYAIFANVSADYFAIDHPNYGSGSSGFPNGTYNLTVDLRGGDGVGGPFPKHRVATGPLLATRTLQFTLGSAPIREGVEESKGLADKELNEEQWLSVGQNPVSTEVVVRLSGKPGQSVELSLTNLQGQTVQQRSAILGSVQQYEVLNVVQAASGLYILKGVKDNQVKTLKVVKIE